MMKIRVWVLLILLDTVLTAGEEKTEKQEAKSLPTSPPTEQQQASNTQKTTELKPGKSGAHGEEEILGPFKEDSKGGLGQADLMTKVAHHNPIVTEKVVYMNVPVPHPYPVEYFKHVPYPLKVPIQVAVHKPYPVLFPNSFHVAVEKKVPFPVVKHVPIHAKTPVELSGRVNVEVPVTEQHKLPFFTTILLPVPHSDIRHIPVYISQDPESQEIHKLKVNKASLQEESAPTSHISTPQFNHYVKISNIPETHLPETHKVRIPGENYQHLTLPEIYQHQITVQYQQPSTPEAFRHEAKSPRVSSHELSTFGGHEEVFVGIVYLSHGHGAEGLGFGYQSVNTH